MEDQRSDIGKGVWFLALMLYSLIFSVHCQSVPSMTLEVSPNMTVQQEGTNVSLLCHVTGLNTTTHILSWVKNEPSGILFGTNRVLYVSDERYRVSFTEGVISTFNLTFSEVETNDTGTYACHFNRHVDDDSYEEVLTKKIVLSVYPRDAFPSCIPNGPMTLTVGSPIFCITSGIATPSIIGENGEWVVYSGEKGEAVLSKYVTTLDNSQTYVCVAKIPASDRNLSCTIGPLNVVDSESTISPNIITTTGITVVKAGLSAGQITGIVIGVIALIILIEIHTLCCRCDPRRWIHPKDYLNNCGSSRETSKARDDTSRSPPDVLTNREVDDVPPSYNSVLEEQSMDASQPDRLRDESNVYGEPTMTTRKPDLNIALRLNLNITVAGANVTSESKHPSDQEPSVGIPHEPYESSDNPLATTNRNHSGIGGKGTPAGAPDPLQQTPQIYAQVNKCRGNNTNASGDNSQTADTTGKPEQPVRKSKKFARRDEVPDEMGLGSSQTVVYADLDLEKEGQDESKQVGKPQETLYADICM